MSVKFGGKVVLVAGGTGGLGRAVALAFLAEGAQVVVTYRVKEGFDALKKAAEKNAASLEGHEVDVPDEIAVGQLIEEIVGKNGRLDAGVQPGGGDTSGRYS